MKKRILSILSLVIITSISAVSAAPQIRLNNYVIDFGEDQATEEIEGELFVPLRKIGELCHFEISWEDGYAIIEKDGSEYKLSASSENVIKDGEEEALNKMPVILNDRMLISLTDAKNLFEIYDDIDQFEGEIALHQDFKYDDEKY